MPRILEIIISLIILSLTLPVTIIIYLLVKLDSKGPIVFSQKRVGKSGRLFIMYKFRTMINNNSDSQRKIKIKKYLNNGTKDKTIDNSQITRFGYILRKTNLDELPQFINVIKGDMSIVGPRPCLPYEWELYNDNQKNRLKIKPGITGYWQVYGRNKVTFDEMVSMDIDYQRKKSLVGDIKIIFLTIPKLFE